MAKYEDTLVLKDKVSPALKRINRSFRVCNVVMWKYNRSIKKSTAFSQNFMKATWGLTKAFVGLVGAGGAIAMGINKVVEYSDRIDKMSQKIGMSAEAFQEWDYIMSQNGGDVDSLRMGFKTLTKQIENVQKGSKDSTKAFNKLGVSVKDNNGRLKSQETVFNETVRALQKMGNTTERDIIANTLFGRSASEMRPLLNKEAKAIDELREKAHRLGLIMSAEDIKASVEFKDTMDTLTRFMQAQMNKAIVPLIPKLQEMADRFMDNKEQIQKVVEMLGKFALAVFTILDYIANHEQVIKFILSVLVGIGSVALWGAIVSGIASATAAMASFGVTSNIALAGIPALIGLIVTGITMLVLNWKKVKEWTINACQTAVNWVKKVVTWVSNLLDKLGFIAYLIPGLSTLKGIKNLADTIHNNNIRQNNTTNNNSNTVTNNNYYGNKGVQVNTMGAVYGGGLNLGVTP